MTAAGVVTSAYSANKAANAQEEASQRAGQISNDQYQQTRTDQLGQYQQTRDDQAPYRDQGVKSLAQLAAGTDAGGQFTQNYQRTAFEADPGYQFRVDQGEQGINRAAAARGGAYSGATLKALSKFNSGLASQEYAAYDQRQNTQEAQFNANRDFQRNNLATLAGIGQTATTATSNAGQGIYNAMASAGTQSANTQAQAAQDTGEARASGYVGVGNSIGSGIKQVYNNYSQNRALSGLGSTATYNGSPVGSGANPGAGANGYVDWSGYGQ